MENKQKSRIKRKMGDLNEILIKEVEKNNCIYNLQADMYKNYYYKQEVWEQIGEVVGVSAKIAKKKWKVLRDSYKRYKRDCQQSGSEGALPKPYKYSDYLRFLDDDTTERNTTCNIPEDETSNRHEDGTSNALETEFYSIPVDTLEAEYYSVPVKKKKVEIQEQFELFLDAATASMSNTSAKVKANSTAQLFESLANKVQESGLTKKEVNEIESSVCSIVYSKIAEFTN